MIGASNHTTYALLRLMDDRISNVLYWAACSIPTTRNLETSCCGSLRIFEPEPLRRTYRLLTRVRDVVSGNITLLPCRAARHSSSKKSIGPMCRPLGGRVQLQAMSLDMMLNIVKYLAFPLNVLVNRILSHLSF